MQCMGLPCKQKDFAFVCAGLNNLPFRAKSFLLRPPRETAKMFKFFLQII